MDQRISQRLDVVAGRTRKLHGLRLATLVWCFSSLALMLSWALLASNPMLQRGFVVSCVLIAFGAAAWVTRRRVPTDAERLAAARLIEESCPELSQRLLTLIDQHPDADTRKFNVLQRQLAHEVLTLADVADWSSCVPVSQLQRGVLRNLLACAVSACLAGVLWMSHDVSARDSASSANDPIKTAAIDGKPSTTIEVEPGDAEVERGSNLLILARFEGPLPGAVGVLKEDRGIDFQPVVSSGESDRLEAYPTTRIEMSKSLDDPVFGTRVANVERPFRYQIQFDDQTTETFNITVFEYPKVEKVDARLEFPSYTGLAVEEIPDTWQIAAVEGSTAVLKCQLNKPIAEGKLVAEDGRSWPLVLSEEKEAEGTQAGRLRYATIPIAKSMKLHFELTDARGRANREVAEFRITALPNKPADIKLTFPAKDQRVSPLEELLLAATVWDDFGIQEHGLMVSIADREPLTVTLGKDVPGKQKRDLLHVVALELMKAEPDQLVSYYFFADDIAADGSSRRSLSDMFFAEVRHFEEIFREGQPPPSGASQQNSPQAQQAEQLGEDQKQIINATWKIMRRETSATLTKTFKDDVTLILESQTALIEKFQKLVETLSDPKSKKFAADAAAAMSAAAEKLGQSAAGPAKEPLTPALASERAAYEALLKLRAREHLITQSKSGGGQGGRAGSPSQQQLSQLELDQKKNRYEAERKANESSPKEAENREQLQVLNRLRELAQRQADTNQKLQEMEQDLREAKSEAEKEELKRQLKRLRDEQRELLNDVDELKNRMEKPENQQRMADSRQQLEETRSQVRQTSQALEEGKLSQALNSGKRAERELQELRDDFRQKAAGQFDDAMKDLRQQAREIGQKQDELAKAIQDPKPDPKASRTLRSTDNRQQLVEDLKQQRGQLDKAVEQARQLVEQAETGEPLLAKELYETVRKARSDKPSEALEVTGELLRRGLTQEAQKAEAIANQGLDRFAEGIERASKLVLGDEAESLKRAREQVKQLGRSVKDELAQNDPQAAKSGKPGTEASEGQPDAKDAGTPAAGEGQGKGKGKEASKPGDAKPGEKGSQGAGKPSEQGEQQPGKPGDQPGDAKSGDAKGGEGQQPSKDSEPKGQGGKPGESPEGKPDSQPGSKPGTQPGQGDSKPRQEPGSKPGEGQSGEGQGGQQPGTQPGEAKPGQQAGQQPGQQAGGARRSPGLRNSSKPSAGTEGGGSEQEGNVAGGPGSPITGPGFTEWSDRMREAEELVTDPKLRAEIARAREAAREMRIEFKRHSKQPEWELVRKQILQPLAEVEKRLSEEIARQQSPDSLVPLDRDPVPERYSDLVRKYYERLGTGK